MHTVLTSLTVAQRACLLASVRYLHSQGGPWERETCQTLQPQRVVVIVERDSRAGQSTSTWFRLSRSFSRMSMSEDSSVWFNAPMMSEIFFL